MSESQSDNMTGSQSDVELTVLRVWREVLGVEDAGPDDDFFELGGDSLVATKLVARLREELDSEVPLLAVFDNPTAAELALELEHA
jgi:acyl carrier protein